MQRHRAKKKRLRFREIIMEIKMVLPHKEKNI